MSRRADFIPRSDAEFNVWFMNFCDKIMANPADYGVLPDELAELTAAYAAWKTNYPAYVADQNQARASRAVKDASRVDSESAGRRIASRIQPRQETTDSQRAGLGINVPDRIRTPLAEEIVLETPPPVIKAQCIASKTVRIDWYPSQAEGQSEALPKGIDGIAIWVADLPAGTLAQVSGGLPTGKQWRLLGMDSNSPYMHNVGNNATVTLVYKAQWFDKQKRMGPFCAPVIVAVTP